MSVLGAGEAFMLASGEEDSFEISKSLRFNSGDSSHLSRTPSSASNRRTWTWSGWVKRSKLGAEQALFGAWLDNSNRNICRFNSSDQLQFLYQSAGTFYGVTTTQVFRDPSAWFHLVLILNTDDSTEADRAQIYVNGSRIADADLSSFGSGKYPPQNTEYTINNTVAHHIGARKESGSLTSTYNNGYLAEVHFVDGQALAASDFGEFDSNNVWQAKSFTGTYGPTVNQSQNWSALGTGEASNSSPYRWEETFDGDESTNGAVALQNDALNLDLSGLSGGGLSYSQSVVITYNRNSAGPDVTVNGSAISATADGTDRTHTITGSGTLTSVGGQTRTASSSGDMTIKKIVVDGKILVDPGTAIADNSFNLDFKDTTSNQALGYDASVDSPARNNRGGFGVVNYTGGTPRSFDLGFQPDLVWIKAKANGFSHQLYDSVRGVNKTLNANTTNAEATAANSLTGFYSNGFSLGSDTNGDVNGGGPTDYIAWAWKAGGAASSNTDGSQTSSVSANTTYGFSVVTGTQSANNTVNTYGHGLGAEPKMIILKRTNGSEDWYVYHKELGNTSRVQLNSTAAVTTGSGVWGSTTPTSSVFTIQSFNAGDFVAYCWSEVSGFSKFGTYSGSSSDVTVTIGFKPRFILIKCTDTAGQEWIIKDSSLGGDKYFEANTTDTAATGRDVTFNSDGFTLAHTQGPTNYNGRTYIYAAFGDRAGNNWTVNNLEAAAGLETAAQGFDVVTYTGNGSTQSISGLNFQPDFLWLKARGQSYFHILVDSVRGNTKEIYSNATTAEVTTSNTVTSFNSNGFSLGSRANTNENSTDYVAWCWKAGGAASSNSDGSITSSVSANQTYGFSVATFSVPGSTPYTVGHGLGSVPKLIILKSRTSSSANWNVYHASTGNQSRSYLNLTNAASSGESCWNNKSPTSSVFSMGSSGEFTGDMVAYCWSEISGFSKFGKYTGVSPSGQTNTVTVTTGFKPKFILIKRIGNGSDGDTAYGGWGMYTSTTTNQLMANCAGAEGIRGNCSGTTNLRTSVSFNDDGFSVSTPWYELNDDNVEYIYAAFADKPPGEIIDSLIDTPTDITADSGNNPGNYATMNPLDKDANCTLSNGNLDVSCSTSGWFGANATMEVIAGKTYFEATYDSGNYVNIGLNTPNTGVGDVNTDGVHLQNDNGTWRVRNGSSATGISAVSVNSIIGVAVDTSANTIQFFVNGTSVYSGTLNALHRIPMVYGYGTYSVSVNFGQRPFAYTPPANHLALVTTNLSDPLIADPSTAFDALTYNGSSSPQTVSGLNFTSDLLWIKSRSHTGWHILQDSIRGFGKSLFSNSSNAEVGNANDLISNVTATGFSVNTNYNNSTDTATTTTSGSNNYVAWAWDAGSSNTSISAGGLNSSLYDQSQTWSSGITTGSSPNSSYGVANAFNGVKTGLSNTCFVNNSSHVQVDFTNLSSASTVTVHYTANGSGVLKVNGTNQTIDGSGSNVYRSVTVNVSGLSSVRWEQADGSNFVGVSGIEVDGKLLVDNGVTLANVPSIASTVRANPSAGFSIIQYSATGSTGTISHQLNAVPDFILAKARGNSGSWMTYHSAYPGGTHGFNFQATSGVYTDNGYWGGTGPDSNVITLGSYTSSTNDWIAYCWSAVDGYSSFGKYTGNGSADGPFVFTGFRPKFILLKRSDASNYNWNIHDGARDPDNVVSARIFPNTSAAESTNVDLLDFTSNGFKLRTNDTVWNASGGTYIYACFAEHPFKTARAR